MQWTPTKGFDFAVSRGYAVSPAMRLPLFDNINNNIYLLNDAKVHAVCMTITCDYSDTKGFTCKGWKTYKITDGTPVG